MRDPSLPEEDGSKAGLGSHAFLTLLSKALRMTQAQEGHLEGQLPLWLSLPHRKVSFTVKRRAASSSRGSHGPSTSFLQPDSNQFVFVFVF